jgi:hypothetical protein
MKQAKLTSEHREAFLALVRDTSAPKEAKALEAARKALARVIKPAAEKAWPKRDMQVLAKYGLASPHDELSLKFGGNGCTCEKVTLPLDDGQAIYVPYEPKTYSHANTLDLDGHPTLVSLAAEYSEAREASKEADKKIRKALREIVNELITPGKPLDRLDQLEALWPDPRVKELADQIRQGLAVLSTDEAARLVTEAFAA